MISFSRKRARCVVAAYSCTALVAFAMTVLDVAAVAFPFALGSGVAFPFAFATLPLPAPFGIVCWSERFGWHACSWVSSACCNGL
eukprot:2750598-Pyramimonas_sp.AAC.1